MHRYVAKGLGLLVLAAAVPAVAQSGPGGPPDGPGGGGPGGPPPFMRQQGRSDAELKEALDVSDEQWKSLQPKIARVQELQRDVAVGHSSGMGMGGPGFGMMGGPPDGPGGGGPPGRGDRAGGPPGGGGGRGPATQPSGRGGGGAFGGPRNRPQGDPSRTAAKPSKVMERFLDLQEALDDKDAKPETLRAKIDAFRSARDEARGELTKLEAELRSMINPTQEATLITMGVLD